MKFKPGQEFTTLARTDGAPIYIVRRVKGKELVLSKWDGSDWSKEEFSIPIPTANATFKPPTFKRSERPIRRVWTRYGQRCLATFVLCGYRVRWNSLSHGNSKLSHVLAAHNAERSRYFVSREDAMAFQLEVGGVGESWSFAVGRDEDGRRFIIGDLSRCSTRTEDGVSAFYVGNYSRTPREVRRREVYKISRPGV